MVSGMPVCALQEVQLYNVDRQRWRPALQAGSEINGLAMAGPQLLLAAAGRDVLLWRGSCLMRSFQGERAAATARRAMPWNAVALLPLLATCCMGLLLRGVKLPK